MERRDSVSVLQLDTEHASEGVKLVGRSISELRNCRCPSWFHQPPLFHTPKPCSFILYENQHSSQPNSLQGLYDYTLKEGSRSRQTIMSLFEAADSRTSHEKKSNNCTVDGRTSDPEESLLRKLLIKLKCEAHRILVACSSPTIFITKHPYTNYHQRSCSFGRLTWQNPNARKKSPGLSKCRSLQYITILPQQIVTPSDPHAPSCTGHLSAGHLSTAAHHSH